MIPALILHHDIGAHLDAAECEPAEEPQQDGRPGMSGALPQHSRKAERIGPENYGDKKRRQSEANQGMQ